LALNTKTVNATQKQTKATKYKILQLVKGQLPWKNFIAEYL